MLNSTQKGLDKDEMERQERIAPMITGGKRFLDIGSSRGYLLQLVDKKFDRVLGVEPNTGYGTYGPSVQFLEAATERGPFDTITCLHVFEHVPDPVTYARKIIDLLAPAGRLILEVPSENSKGGPLRLWHLYLFMPPIIMRLFEGLKLVSFEENPHFLFVSYPQEPDR
jgi:2-polyprenyl-3-methyl-5-hydroxy-6-metoxy-1,4-benzoquinol methylase